MSLKPRQIFENYFFGSQFQKSKFSKASQRVQPNEQVQVHLNLSENFAIHSTPLNNRSFVGSFVRYRSFVGSFVRYRSFVRSVGRSVVRRCLKSFLIVIRSLNHPFFCFLLQKMVLCQVKAVCEFLSLELLWVQLYHEPNMNTL